MPLTVAKN